MKLFFPSLTPFEIPVLERVCMASIERSDPLRAVRFSQNDPSSKYGNFERQRLKSIKNIQKITKSMKMVAAAKYARAERELKPARVYGTGSLALYEKADIKVPEDMKKHLLIGVSSDRGLCGAIHSSVAKQMKSEVATLTAAGKEVKIVGIGDKIRAILHRTHSDQFLVTFKEVGRKPLLLEMHQSLPWNY
ncbi:hypothetical protein QTO34_008089 [Cnephaeus nilssonii]|uniref:F-ATPase gamma subunit n=1 Tax=Cnephaeus nilssonii TaxID=3371016 RepID=A0AA40IA16_CNENI|nr:hypothetical protein QTO34_008089 [Eptesicus nilssonii]